MKIATSILFAAPIVSCLALDFQTETAMVRYDATLNFSESMLELKPVLFDQSWAAKNVVAALETGVSEDMYQSLRIDADDYKWQGKAKFYNSGANEFRGEYVFTPSADCTPKTFCLQLSLPTDVFAGTRFIVNDGAIDKILPLDLQPNPILMHDKNVKTLVLFPKCFDTPIRFEFENPVSIMLQDDRKWSTRYFRVRITFPETAAGKYSAGIDTRIAMRVSKSDGLNLKQYSGPVVMVADKDWLPIESVSDVLPGSALDFSAIVPSDKPAGVHGYVVAKGENFEFADMPGVPQRFYGVNTCFSANYPSLEDARKFAVRLRRIGYNALRIHHHDNYLAEGAPAGEWVNPAHFAQLDNLAAACIEEGIYLTTDLFVSRAVPYRAIGIDKDGNVPAQEFKQLVLVLPAAFENYIAFTKAFLTHVNPHTGRAWGSEPALSWISLINEGNLGNVGCQSMFKYDAWSEAWEEWLSDRKARFGGVYLKVDASARPNLWDRGVESVVMTEFLREKEDEFERKMRHILQQELGCKALLTNLNCWFNPVSYQLVRDQNMDYVDDHFYVDHPEFIERSWSLPSRCPNTNPFRNSSFGARDQAYRRLADKPFTITEYNFAAPGRYRGVGGICVGAFASLQNWAGLWRFAWSHDQVGVANPQKRSIAYFDMAGDPLGLASERASIMLFLRQDLQPLTDKSFAIDIPSEVFKTPGAPDPINNYGITAASWYSKLFSVVDAKDKTLPQAVQVCDYRDMPSKRLSDIVGKEVNGVIEAPQYRIDNANGIFIIRTPRTSGGFAAFGTIDAGFLKARIGDVPTTIWVSALDDKPLPESSRMLLSHVTEVQNSGAKFADEERSVLLSWGTLPHLIRAGKADVSIAVENPANLAVYALDPSGRRIAEIPTNIASNNALEFALDMTAIATRGTYLYEIVRKARR